MPGRLATFWPKVFPRFDSRRLEDAYTQSRSEGNAQAAGAYCCVYLGINLLC